jgi:hypothetical protein
LLGLPLLLCAILTEGVHQGSAQEGQRYAWGHTFSEVDYFDGGIHGTPLDEAAFNTTPVPGFVYNSLADKLKGKFLYVDD